MMSGFWGMFSLMRDVDVTGVSGIGYVASGAEFPDGTVSVRWNGKHATSTIHDSLESVEVIHLHAGRTRLHWRWRSCCRCLLTIMVDGVELMPAEEHGEGCKHGD